MVKEAMNGSCSTQVTFNMLAAADTTILFLRLWVCAHMLSIVCVGLSMCTTGKNCDEGPSKSLPFNYSARTTSDISWLLLNNAQLQYQSNISNNLLETNDLKCLTQFFHCHWVHCDSEEWWVITPVYQTKYQVFYIVHKPSYILFMSSTNSLLKSLA